jgi:hypothetical protein
MAGHYCQKDRPPVRRFLPIISPVLPNPKKTREKGKNRINGKCVFDFNPNGFSLIPIVFFGCCYSLAEIPPSTFITVPVIHFDSSVHKNNTALVTSSGSPILFSGNDDSKTFFAPSSWR